LSLANDDRTTGGPDALEELLDPQYKVSLETDALDFLLLAGLIYDSPAFKASARADLREQVRSQYQHREATNPVGHHDTRVRNALYNAYINERFRTLGELKTVLAQGGVRHFGRGSVYRLNELLVEHDVAPFRSRKTRGSLTLEGQSETRGRAV